MQKASEIPRINTPPFTRNQLSQITLATEVTKLGGKVETKLYPNDDHFSLPNHCAPDAREWLNGLF